MPQFIPLSLAVILLVISTVEFIALFTTGIAIDFIKRDAPYMVTQTIVSGFQVFTAIMLFWRFNTARVMLLWGMPIILIGTIAVYVNADRIGAVFWVNHVKLAWYAFYVITFTRPALVDQFKNS